MLTWQFKPSQKTDSHTNSSIKKEVGIVSDKVYVDQYLFDLYEKQFARALSVGADDKHIFLALSNVSKLGEILSLENTQKKNSP